MVSELMVDTTTTVAISIIWIFQMNGTYPRTEVNIEIWHRRILINTVVEEPSRTFSMLTGLQPLKMYTITVYALSRLGRSLPSTINASTLSIR